MFWNYIELDNIEVTSYSDGDLELELECGSNYNSDIHRIYLTKENVDTLIKFIYRARG
jgi:Holliday junction resolvase